MYANNDRGIEAIQEFEQVLKLDPRPLLADLELTALYLDRHDIDRAFTHAPTPPPSATSTRPCSSRRPQSRSCRTNLTSATRSAGFTSNATWHQQRSPISRPTPDDPVAQYHLGMAYYQVGDWPNAKRTLSRALQLNPAIEGASDARKALTVIGG